MLQYIFLLLNFLWILALVEIVESSWKIDYSQIEHDKVTIEKKSMDKLWTVHMIEY